MRALAQDLEHWLADEPTAAYPESRVEKTDALVSAAPRLDVRRGRRAGRRFRLVAIVAAAVIEGARRGEEMARKEAETNFDMAQQAVEDYLTNVSENTLLKEQDSVDIRRLRQDLLKSALTYYEKFAARRKNDPLLRQQLAKAYFRVGQITREIDSLPQAMTAFRSAQAIWEPMVEANPNDHELAGNLAECYLAMGKLRSIDSNQAAALEMFSRSRAILEPLRVKTVTSRVISPAWPTVTPKSESRMARLGRIRREPGDPRQSQSHPARFDRPLPG